MMVDLMISRLRGLPKTTQRIDRLSNLTISAMTYLELPQGMRVLAEVLDGVLTSASR